MKIEIVYIHHSSFSVEMDERVLLFDYPGGGYERNNLVKNIVNGKELYVFVSHSHRDHFDPAVIDLSRYASDVTNFISHDVFITYPDLDFCGETIEVKPGERFRQHDLKVRSFESNDAGVAYLIGSKGKSVYFGGDLAKWDWPEWGEEKREKHVKVFRNTLKTLGDQEITIAFSNMDERLESWAGPMDLIGKVEPEYFVPIHTFGNVEWIDDLVRAVDFPKDRIFIYEKTGDNWVLDL